MLNQYIELNTLLRNIRIKALDLIASPGEEADELVRNYILHDLAFLRDKWPKDLDTTPIQKMGDELSDNRDKGSWHYGFLYDYLPQLEESLESYYLKGPFEGKQPEIIDLLHPAILSSSYQQLRVGHYRDAVFNSIVAVFDLIRSRTNIDMDGASLVAEVFSLSNPKLIISDIDTESGRNEQKGFIQILQGIYLGVRNPKAHSLISDLTREKALQYLILSSLLARRIDEANRPD